MVQAGGTRAEHAGAARGLEMGVRASETEGLGMERHLPGDVRDVGVVDHVQHRTMSVRYVRLWHGVSLFLFPYGQFE